MKRRNFIGLVAGLSGVAVSADLFAKKSNMKIHFLRHATLIVEVNGVKILVDPMLSSKHAMDPVKITRNPSRIPMRDLPIDEHQLSSLLTSVDAVMVTHLHRDHWDEQAKKLIDKKTVILCQPSDAEAIKAQHFDHVMPVDSSIEFKGLQISRTGGQHGTGDIGVRMGHVSGFVIENKKEKIYIAGDTIWCTEVEEALSKHQPQFVVVNAGAARFDEGDPITMTAEDVAKVCHALPKSKVIAVHMDTVNHCDLTRDQLKIKLNAEKLLPQCIIPNDGDMVGLS